MIASNVILTPDKLADAVDYFRNEPERLLSFDLETFGPDRGVPHCNSASWIGLAARGRTAVIPFGHPIGSKVVGQAKEPRTDRTGKTKLFRVPVYEGPPPQLERDQVFEALEPLMFSEDIIKIGHGMQFDLATIAKYYGGRIPAGPHCDTIVLRWLLDENRLKYGLKYVTKDDYGYSYDDEDVGKCVEKYPFSMVSHYLHCDVLYPLVEYRRLRPRIDEEGLQRVYDMEMALLPILARMRLTGMPVDVQRLEELREELVPRVQQVEGKVYAAAGRKFDLNYYRAKADVLYTPKSEGGQGLKPWRLTKGARDKQKRIKDFKPGLYDWSTDAEALEHFVDNPVVAAILDYQEWNKLLSTYVLGYLGVEGDKKKPCRIYDRKIFADFVQYAAVTGRFGCREPNLQNISRPDTELGALIRGAFVAEPGRSLVVADYDQIELVVLAHYLGQGKLYEGFLNGIDPHTMRAAGVTGKKPFITKAPGDGGITKDERQKLGKTLGFAISYGAGDAKIASMMGVPVREARAVLRRDEEEFPEIYGFKQYTIDTCRRQRPPHISTLFGRKRRVPGINSSDRGMRLYCERQAFNALIQGGAADIMKFAMTRLAPRMPDWMQLHLSVHDELVCSAPDDRVEEGRAILLDAMTGPGIGDMLRVPLKSDCAIVKRWSDAK